VTTLAFMSANFLAKESGYQLSGGWMAGDRATNARFAPLESFTERFAELLGQMRWMGFDAPGGRRWRESPCRNEDGTLSEWRWVATQ
jgi:hypothetical protein